MVVPVRGTKTDDRDRPVPIVTDEQVFLIEFVLRHAAGSGERLFCGPPNRLITDACTRAGVEHASPHHFRHAAGQWLLDVGVSIELVSRVLGHSSTSVAERVYARVKKNAVGDRILDVIDPAYAKSASRARRKKVRRIETITSIPEPKQIPTYTVGGQTLTLDGWAKRSGIPKSTLYWRVILQGWSMPDALAKEEAGPRSGCREISDGGSFDCREILAPNGSFWHSWGRRTLTIPREKQWAKTDLNCQPTD